MHRAEALAKGHRALGSGHHHVPTSILVASVTHGTKEVSFADAPHDPVTGHRIGRWIHWPCKQRLDAMRHRIHTGRSGQQRRQAERERRVADRSARNEVLAHKNELLAIVHDDDCAARHFTARASGRGNSNQWRDGSDLPRTSQAGGVPRQIPVVCHRQRDGLGKVHG